MIDTKIYHSTAYNPWYNLAFEEYLLNQVKDDEIILYLWQNDNTVVIGRNQNAWKECRCELFEKEGGKIARRLSGGGAVYHDLGNLNFTFIMGKDNYDLKRQLQVILEAVKDQDIEAEFSGRNDLIVNGKKFSGNAFYFGSESAYHHGTILVDTDFTKLVKYLQVSQEKIKSKGVDSVRSRVINLKELKPDLTIEDVKSSMAKSFQDIYGGEPQVEEVNTEEFADNKNLYEKYSSWEWRFGRTPDFDITFAKRFDWGDIEIGLTAKQGHVDKAMVYSDAMEADLIEDIAVVLVDIPFTMDNIIDSIDSISVDEDKKHILEDIKNWLQTKSV